MQTDRSQNKHGFHYWLYHSDSDQPTTSFSLQSSVSSSSIKAKDHSKFHHVLKHTDSETSAFRCCLTDFLSHC